MPCGSFTVTLESESTEMGNVRIVQRVLTRPTVKHTNSADTDKSMQCICITDGPDRPIRSRIPGPLFDTEPVRANISDFEKMS